MSTSQHHIIDTPWSLQDRRQDYIFRTRSIPITDEDGRRIKFPVIVLYDKKDDLPIAYPGFERWFFRMNTAEGN